MFGSVLRRRIANKISGLSLRFSYLHRFAVDADPAQLRYASVPARVVWGTETLTTLSLAIGLSDLNQLPSFACLQAAPTEFAIREGFLFCSEILAALLLAFVRSTREDLSVQTAPALWHTIFLVRLRFILCGIAFAAFVLAIHPRGLGNFAVKAAPPTCLAISDRIFFRRVPLTAFLPAFDVGHLDHFAVKAAPAILWAAIFLRVAERVITLGAFCLALSPRRLNYLAVDAGPVGPATLDRFFRRLVASASVRLTLGCGAHVNDTFETAVTPARRWRQVMAAAIIGTGQGPVPAMRRIGRASRVRSRRSMPRVRVATRFPRPSTPLLRPNPLATRIAPIPAIDRRRGQQERMLLAIDANAFTNNEAAIVDGFGDSEYFKVARR